MCKELVCLAMVNVAQPCIGKPTGGKWRAGARPSDWFSLGNQALKIHPDYFSLLLLKLPCPGLKQQIFIAYLQGNFQSLYEFSQGRSVISSPPFPSAFIIFISLIVPEMQTTTFYVIDNKSFFDVRPKGNNKSLSR